MLTANMRTVADPGLEIASETGDEKQPDTSGPRFRCNWQPRKHDRWACVCGHYWNTFDTGGICPACLHQWMTTQCLSCPCSRWSAHSDWYEC
jgi:hypothetical protein